MVRYRRKFNYDCEVIMQEVVISTVAEPSTQVATHYPMADERFGEIRDFWIDGHEGTFRFSFYPDGRIGEIFIDMAKEGSTLSGFLDAVAIGVSAGLQRGIPMEVFIEKYKGMRFEPMGPTRNPEIPEARSIVDYIFSWFDLKYFQKEEQTRRA